VIKTDCGLCEVGNRFYIICRQIPWFEGLVMLSRAYDLHAFSKVLLKLANLRISNWNHTKGTKYFIHSRSIKFPWIWLGLVFLSVYCFLVQNVRYWQILSIKITRIKVELLCVIELISCCNSVLFRRRYACVKLKTFASFGCKCSLLFWGNTGT
jgi:hypothetical protein